MCCCQALLNRAPDTLTLNVEAEGKQDSFVVGHQLAPTTALVRRRHQRWERYASGDLNERVDSSFFFKDATTTCTHTQCPVYGKPGVFECIDTQTNLDMCGGCAPLGQVCSDIVGAVSIECVGGRCLGEFEARTRHLGGPS